MTYTLCRKDFTLGIMFCLVLKRLHQLPDAQNVVIVFPHDRAWKRFHKQLRHFPTVVCAKVREGDKRIVRLKEGDPAGRHVVNVDDLVQSGDTLIECQKVLAAHGATKRMIQAESPDLIVFTGDNIYGPDTTNPEASMNAAFAPAISSNIPWTAVLGNHDQESTLSRQDGFGNYNLEVFGTQGSDFVNKSILNLYFLDSGDYYTVPSIPGYGWIKPSQQFWFQEISMKLQNNTKTPGLAYFHIPLPEYSAFTSSNFTGVKQEGISSASVNSGFFTAMVESGDVKAVFTGHDHLNDFCGVSTGINLCYGGGRVVKKVKGGCRVLGKRVEWELEAVKSI